MSDFVQTPFEPELEPTPALDVIQVQVTEAPSATLFEAWSRSEPVPAVRIPHLGHLGLLVALLTAGYITAMIAIAIGIHFHYDGISTFEQVKTSVPYLLGSEVILYFVTFALGYFIFPKVWGKSLFVGMHWRGSTALRLIWPLLLTAVGCFGLAVLDDRFLPGPQNAPIEDFFRSPGAAWLMFGFGVAFAPFFEEIGFRGFMLPALATGCDWVAERFTGRPPRPLDEHDHPQWSRPAMVVASLATSLPFALLHAQQTGWSIGPFIAIIAISLVLCAVRIATRSLASSTLVHACYNFLLFFTTLISSGGFHHMDRL